ncbi:MAG: uracil-DNA glycosylase family protein [Pseudomonadota bacterium]
MTTLDTEIRACRLCEADLPHEPRPVFAIHPQAKVLIAGQAPGRKVHEHGVAFDDASGDRLREWMGIGRTTFYDPTAVAIVPMGFCYPGKGKSGDLPPLPRCAETWRSRVLATLEQIRLTLIIGQYAQRWHLPDASRSVTDAVRDWRQYPANTFVLPHPSPRNNIWLKKNPWFANEVLPMLRDRVAAALQ